MPKSKFRRNIACCLSILLLSGSGLGSNAYSQSISGRVVDSLSNDPLPGASILFPKKDTVILTTANGSFYIRAERAEIRVAFPGYKVLNKTCVASTPCLIKLMPDTLLRIPTVTVRSVSPYREKASSVYQLDRREMEMLSSFGVQEVLSAYPAVQMEQGAWNTNRISLRGIGSRTPFSTSKLRVYLDEIPLTNGIGESTIEDLDPAIFEKIQVQPGPNPGQYGAALGGTILLRSLNRSAWPQRQIKTDWRIGSFGRIRGSHSFHWKDKPSTHSLALHLHHMHSDGFRENNKYDRRGVDLFYRHQINPDHQVQILGSLVDLKAFIPSSLGLDDFRAQPRKAAEVWAAIKGFEDYVRGLGAVSYTGILTSRISIGSSFFYSNRRADESRPFNFLEEDSHRYGNRTRITFRDSIGRAVLTGHTGFELFLEDHNWNTYSPVDQQPRRTLTLNREFRQNTSLFSDWNLALNSYWDINFALHANRTTYELDRLFSIDGTDPSGDYSFDWIISPQLGAVYHGSINTNMRFDVFSRIANGYSAPTLEETLTPDGVINPEIKPETGWNAEAGLRAFHRKDTWAFQLNYYRMWVRDLLVARRTNFDQFIGINAGKTLHQGIEASFSWSARLARTPAALWLVSGRISYHYADYKFVEFIDGENDYSGNDLTGNAPHNAWAMIRFHADIDRRIRPFFQLITRLQDKRPVADDNDLYTEAYFLAHARIGLDWDPDSERRWTIETAFEIRNLGDANYPAMLQVNAPSFGGSQARYFYPGAPRNYTLRVALSHRF